MFPSSCWVGAELTHHCRLASLYEKAHKTRGGGHTSNRLKSDFSERGRDCAHYRSRNHIKRGGEQPTPDAGRTLVAIVLTVSRASILGTDVNKIDSEWVWVSYRYCICLEACLPDISSSHQSLWGLTFCLIFTTASLIGFISLDLITLWTFKSCSWVLLLSQRHKCRCSSSASRTITSKNRHETVYQSTELFI